MKRIFLFGCILLAFGCKKNDFNCHPERFTYTILPQSDITIDTSETPNFSIVEGSNMVFEYQHLAAQCDDVFDDEWGEILYFAIDTNATEFQNTDEQLAEIQCIYNLEGAWVGARERVKLGSIAGEKLSEKLWRISIDLTLQNEFVSENRIVVNEIFILP
jgi:hypothetical protein